jgi:hypothetical protein
MRSRTLVLTIVTGLAAANALPAQTVGTGSDGGSSTPASARAVRLADGPSEAAIRIDGLLDEEVWVNAPASSGFKQREPQEGQDPSETTEVRVVYDDETLYIGVLARDREPDQIIARILQRDRLMAVNFRGQTEFAGDDAIAILLDPFHDHKNAVVFATNPNGAEFEALITDEGREFNVDWRAVWEVKAARHADGWSAEFAIPFRTLRYPSNGDGEPWGFNVYRIIRRKNEEVLWRSWSRDNEGFVRVSRAGHLDDLQGLPRSNFNVEMKPFLLGGGTHEDLVPSGTSIETTVDAGVDLKYEVRPGLLLDLTVNTDFAQVEVDDQQVNLTRFNLFFPEKRDFFLENSGIFEFGVRGRFFEPPPFLLFFSRRVGISDDGEVPVMGGARVTGRVGQQTVGFLNVVTDRAHGDPRANFAVARVKRDVGENNYIGAMVTDKRQGEEANTTGGIDWSFWPNGQLNLQGFFARMQTSGDGGDDNAYRFAADYVSDFWNISAAHLFIGEEANTEMGFRTRTNIRRSNYNIRMVPRPDVLGLRRLILFSSGDYVTRPDGLLQDYRFSGGFSPTWNSGDNFFVSFARGFTRLDEEFELTDDVLVPIGDYDTWEISSRGNTSTSRPLMLATDVSYQRFFDGRLLRLGGDITASFGSHLAITTGYTRNSVDIPWGKFDADIARLRMTLAASTKFIANALLQYNSLDRDVSANIRLNFIHRPGSDFFLVFTEERGSESSVWDFGNRGVVAKITYLTRI